MSTRQVIIYLPGGFTLHLLSFRVIRPRQPQQKPVSHMASESLAEIEAMTEAAFRAK